MMKKTLLCTLATASLLQLSGCATTSTTQAGAVGVERKQYVGLVSEQEAEEQSALAYQQTVKESQGKKILNTDSQETQRVRNIANRLIAQVGVFRPDALKWKWEVNVMESEEVNAY